MPAFAVLWYKGEDIVDAINTGETSGGFSGKERQEIRDWSFRNKEKPLENWALVQSGELPHWISWANDEGGI